MKGETTVKGGYLEEGLTRAKDTYQVWCPNCQAHVPMLFPREPMWDLRLLVRFYPCTYDQLVNLARKLNVPYRYRRIQGRRPRTQIRRRVVTWTEANRILDALLVAYEEAPGTAARRRATRRGPWIDRPLKADLPPLPATTGGHHKRGEQQS